MVKRGVKKSAKSVDASATEEVDPTAESTVEPKAPKRGRKNAAVAEKSGPMPKRAKGKLKEEILPPDAIQSVPSLQSDPTKSSEPIPDAATSLSNVAVVKSIEGRSIVHVDHKTGNVLGIYKSCFAAAKSVGISRHIVESLVKGVYKANHHKGSKFRCATVEEEPPVKAPRSRSSDIEQVDVSTGKVIATFRSILAASKATGVGRKDITSILDGELESKNGFIFRYPVLPDIVKSEPVDKDGVEDVKLHASANNKNKKVETKLPKDEKLDSKDKSGKKSKASKKESTAKKPKKTSHMDESEDVDFPDVDVEEDAGEDDASTDYTVHEITVTEDGSLGIMARKAKAPEEALSLLDLFDGDSQDELNLCIASFTGAESIAKKFGMKVGDFIFVAAGGSEEGRTHGEYKSTAFYIRRSARPTTFYVVRSKSKVIPSITKKGKKVSSTIADDDTLDDMDPMKDMQENNCNYTFQPITITEPGSLGIKVAKRKELPKDSDSIPYFNEMEGDSYIDCSMEGSLLVESLIGKNCLARKFGIQAGDYLVLPSSEYTPAKYNYQEAFYLDTYEGVRGAIENAERPLTLYAVRLKTTGSTAAAKEVIEIESADGEAKAGSDKGEDFDDESEGSYHCSGFEGWKRTHARVVAMSRKFRKWKNGRSASYDHEGHLKRCQRGIKKFLKLYPPGWPNVDRWEARLTKMDKEYKESSKATKRKGKSTNVAEQKEEDWYDEEMIGNDDEDDDDGDDDDDDEEEEESSDEEDNVDDDDVMEDAKDDDEEGDDDDSEHGEEAWQIVEDKVIAMEKAFWKWRKGKNPTYNHKRLLKLCQSASDHYVENHYHSGCDDADQWDMRMRRMTKVYRKLRKAEL